MFAAERKRRERGLDASTFKVKLENRRLDKKAKLEVDADTASQAATMALRHLNTKVGPGWKVIEVKRKD